MPRSHGYQPLSQVDDEDHDPSTPRVAEAPTTRRLSRPRLGKIDLSGVDSSLKRWRESIRQRFRGKKKPDPLERREIAFSVFEPYPVAAVPGGPIKTLDHNPPMTHEQFDTIINSIKEAILEGTHPKMIAKGSSGSYFARAKDEDRVKTVGVFKPKDEEPYGRLNPKTTKWLHRQLRWIIPFGRACLIPNLSYISEAAASLLDTRLDLHIVPRTDLVSISSPAFFYDWIDRAAAKNGKNLPEKIGSLQYFLHGYTDASVFLREHPWPGRPISDTFDDENHRSGVAMKRVMGALQIVCGRTGEEDELHEEDEEDEQIRALYDVEETRDFYWTLALQQDFRLELEKLIILDYIIRNTDRGADNYMIKYCNETHDKRSVVDTAPTRADVPAYPAMMREVTTSTAPSSIPPMTWSHSSRLAPSGATDGVYSRPHMHIAAIDNSLSFPHEHPKGWRSFTYGWLYLPVSLIGRPFSEQTRRHFLPLLSSKEWWEETVFELKKLFAVDPDFHPKMFARQLAVMKGQAWNVVQSLKHPDEGPLELTRRVKVLVWDEEIEVAEDFNSADILGPTSAEAAGPSRQAAKPSGPPSVFGSRPPVRRMRSVSGGAAALGSFPFPPPIHRTSTDITGVARPVPFASKVSRVNPGATGVSVLEHMEKLDKVEAGLKRLGIEEEVLFEQNEEQEQEQGQGQGQGQGQEQEREREEGEDEDDDLPEMSMSTPTLPPRPHGRNSGHSKRRSEEHGRSSSHLQWASQTSEERRGGRSLDWRRGSISDAGSLHAPRKKVVIAERLETVEVKPLFSCW